MFQSVQKIFSLPEETRMFMCHDYLPAGRTEYVWETTVREEKKRNVHLKAGTQEQEFIEARTARDKTLGMPKLIIPSLQVNMRAGNLPEAEANGVQYLKIPLNNIFAKE